MCVCLILYTVFGFLSKILDEKTNTGELDSSFKQNFGECEILLLDLHYGYFLRVLKLAISV